MNRFQLRPAKPLERIACLEGFDPVDLSDTDLRNLRRVAIAILNRRCPPLGEWLFNWCDHESAVRAGLAERDECHDNCCPPLDDFPSRTVGQALEAISYTTYFVPDAVSDGTRHVLDRVAFLVNGRAAKLLEKENRR